MRDYTRPADVSPTTSFSVPDTYSNTLLTSCLVSHFSHVSFNRPKESTNVQLTAILRVESQQQRYASFSCCANRVVIKHGPQAAVHLVLFRSTPSTMILFLTSFPPGSLPRLYIWHTSCRHAGTFAYPSSRHRALTDRDISAEDEEGIILALEQHDRDRVRRIRLSISISKLQKFIVAIDEEYPVLEYLIMRPLEWGKRMALTLPGTLRAPRLRHLVLQGFAFPIGCQLLTNAASIVTLYLYVNHPDAYFQPNTLLQWLSSMPQLETLGIFFFFFCSQP
jgi:hypothetical protein